MNILDFANKYNIPFNKITVNIVDGIKKPTWDNKSMKLIDVLERKQPKNFNNYSLFLKYSIPIKDEPNKKIFCVDLDNYKNDTWNNSNEDDLIKCEIYKILKDDNCYYTKTKKGLHYYCILNNVPEYTNEKKVYYNKDFEIDLICRGNNMWEQKDRLVYGDKLSHLNFEDIKHLFILKNSKQKKNDIENENIENENIENDFTNEKTEYLISNSKLNFIFNKLNLDEYDDFFKFTVICKYFDKFDDWDRIAQKHKNYNKKNNLKMWNTIDVSKFEGIIHKIIYKDLKELELYNKIKFKPIMELNKKEYFKEGNYDKLSKYIKLDDEENYIIQSCQGTGKTTLIKETFKNTKKLNFISIVSRINLAHSHYFEFINNDIECQVYDNLENDKEKNYITTIESLTKIENEFYKNTLDIKTYTIFLDEFQSLLEHLLDTTTIKNRVEAWHFFCEFIKECYNFYAVDADISDNCIEFLKEIRPDYKYIKNNFEHFKGVEAEEIFHEDDLINRCKEDIKNKQKFFICCDSEATANYLKHKINCGELKIITSKFRPCKSFNLNEQIYLIFSPSIIYGLDDLQYRNIYCFYKEHTISPPQMVQQITRCRNIKKLFYFFNKKKYTKPRFNNIEDVEQYVESVEKYGLRRFKYFSKNDSYANLYKKLLIRHLYDKDCFETNKALHFQNYIRKRGFVIIDNDRIGDYKCNDKIIKKVFQNILNENFNVNREWIQNTNKYLKLKEDKDIIYYKEFFTDKKLLKEHFNISNYFYKDKKLILHKIKNEEDKDFNYNIFKKDIVKIDYLNKLKSKYKINFDDNNKLNIEWDNYINNEKIYNDYVKLFNIRSKKDFINSEYECLLMIGDIYKKLFGNIIHKKSTKIKSSGEGQRIYNYYLNPDDLIIHENLYNFRKKKEEDIFD